MLTIRENNFRNEEENTKEPVINQQETINTEEKVDANVDNQVEAQNIEEAN